MTNIIVFFAVMQILHWICTWRLYKLAGYKGWQAAVPFYSVWILLKITKRPWWWIILLYIPIAGNIMALVIWTDMTRAFGYRNALWTVLSIVTLGLSLGYISYFGHPTYDAEYKVHRQKLDSSVVGAIAFALVAASLIKAFTYEAYIIPSSSMEGSMLVGDYVFVNKMSYGLRIPMTPLSIPLLHDSIPGTGMKSYIKGIHLPYMRTPALREIKRNDIVVFNWPADSASKPIDKKLNYIKRCVALPGDNIIISQGTLFVNGKKQVWDERSHPQWTYLLRYKRSITSELMKMGVEFAYNPFYDSETGGEKYYVYTSEAMLEKIKALYPEISAQRLSLPIEEPSYKEGIFPEGRGFNCDYYGILTVPQKGDTITLSSKNISQYRAIISNYEGNTLEELPDSTFVINGDTTSTYVIRKDYYFMMGDNRHNSLDSRYWGYVPEDHIVGRPAMVWFSVAADDGTTPFFKRIRWERVMSIPQGEGPLKSYLWHVVAGAAVIYAASSLWMRHRKKKKNAAGKNSQS